MLFSILTFLCRRVFHILDSLRNEFPGKKEARQLQNILLKNFEDKPYRKGLIAANIARVILPVFLVIS